MIHDLKPYAAYKPSGVPWLGEVPVHWEVRRLKRICRLAYGAALTTERRQDGTVPVFGSNGRVGFHSSANTKAPCIVVGRKGSFGKVNYSRGSVYAIDTTFFIDSRFSSAHVRWLFFLLGWLRLDEVTKDSAVPGLDREDAYQRLAPVPPLPEQTAIVRFLDHADRRIQRYIRAKQKLIALLEEQKQALTHQAVTGQIDVRTGQPYPATKPSGVEWLGDVPAHWQEISLGRCLRRIAQGWSPTAAEGDIEPNQWSVLTLSSVKRGMFDATAIKPIPLPAKIPDGIEIKDGDLLLTRSNTRELVGDVCIVEGARPKTVLSDLIYRLTPELAILERRFLMFQLLSIFGRRQIERDARGSSGTMPKIA